MYYFCQLNISKVFLEGSTVRTPVLGAIKTVIESKTKTED